MLCIAEPSGPVADRANPGFERPNSDLARQGMRLVIEHTVMCVFDVADSDLQRCHRGRAKVALARQTAMYLAHTAFGMTLTQVGLLFARDRTTVAHACAVIEDRRDDSNFDRVLELLERAVKALQAPRFFLPHSI
jgi:chromosomal replication initiation ATPase DnaA